jgi:hypothetical protein
MTIDEALRIARSEYQNPYAQAYLRALPDAIELDGLDAYEAQVRYIIYNLKRWRGERARECRQVIREWLAQRDRDRREHKKIYGI